MTESAKFHILWQYFLSAWSFYFLFIKTSLTLRKIFLLCRWNTAIRLLLHQRHFSRFNPLTYIATNDDFVNQFQDILFNHTTSNETISLEPMLEPFMRIYWPSKGLKEVKTDEQEVEIFFEKL